MVKSSAVYREYGVIWNRALFESTLFCSVTLSRVARDRRGGVQNCKGLGDLCSITTVCADSGMCEGCLARTDSKKVRAKRYSLSPPHKHTPVYLVYILWWVCGVYEKGDTLQLNQTRKSSINTIAYSRQIHKFTLLQNMLKAQCSQNEVFLCFVTLYTVGTR